jgi:hypothetical protein
MDKKDIMLKEIDIIQSIITRMWTNSFLIKWWTLTLVVWIIALDKFNDSNWIWLLAVIMATIITFWRLDSYFLQQERLYRKLYKWVIENRSKSDEHIFDMDTKRLFRQEDCRLHSFFSKTIRPIYTLLIIITIAYSYFTF